MIKVSYISNNEEADISYLTNYQLEDLLKGLNLIEISSKKEAQEVALFLKDKGHYDIFIMSEKLSFLKAFYKIYKDTRLVLKVRDFKDVDLLKSSLYENNISLIILDSEKLNQSIIRKLKLDGIRVVGSVTSEQTLYKAILSGVDGVIGTELSRVAIAADLVMMPFLVSHRGNHQEHVENSIDAGLEGYKSGADFLEMDVHVTKDGAVVVNHDSTLTRTYNKEFSIREHTYDELLVANLRKDDQILPDKLPLLANFDEIIPNDFNFLIEVKSETKEEALIVGEVLNNLKRAFQVMTFFPVTAEALASVVKKDKNGFIINYHNKGDIFEMLLRGVNKFNLNINPFYGADKLAYRNDFYKRMVEYSPWGIKEHELVNALGEGFDKLSSDDIHIFKGITKKLSVKDDILYKMFGENKKVILSDDLGRIVDYETNILFGNPLGLVFSKDELVGASKKGVSYLYLTHKFTFLNKEFKMVSDLIRVEVI